MGKKRVLITGAAGHIGSWLAESLKDRYDLRLHYHNAVPATPPVSDVHIADISKYDEIAPAMEGIDAVIHMAGDSRRSSPWEDVLQRNIIGTYNVYESARRAGVKKVILASTNHTMGMYDRDQQWPIYITLPHRPDSLYGVSKAFGETLGRHFYDQFGLHIICLRIGWFLPEPRDEIGLWMWLSPRDATQVVWRAIESPVQYGVFYAISRNARRRWDITDTIVKLGYRPEDDAEIYASKILGEAAGA